MSGDKIIEATYISADSMDDPDTAAEFDAFADDMRQTESADAWITVLRIPTDAQGNARSNTKHNSELFREPLGATTIADIIERVREGFMAPGDKATIRVIGSQKGVRGIKFNKVISIERAKEKGGAAPAGNSFADVMRMMQESQRLADERAERLIQSMTTRVSPVVDPMDQMAKMMAAMGAMMGPMMAVMAGRPMTPAVDPADSLVKLATTMKTLDGMFGKGGSAPEDDSIASIVKALAPAATPMLQLMAESKRQQNLQLARQPPRTLPAPKKVPPKVAPATPAAPAQDTASNLNIDDIPPLSQQNGVGDPQQEKTNMELAEMKKNLDTVANLCDEGRSPDEVAKLVLAMIPQEQDTEFFDLIADDDYVNNMALLNPRVAERRAWFEKLREAMLAEFEPDNDDTVSV